MPTYDEVWTLGFEWGIVALLPILGILLFWLEERFRKRRWVFIDLQLRSGPSFRKQYPVRNGGVKTKRYGFFKVTSIGMSGTFRGKPLYRFLEDNPYPIVYTHRSDPILEKKKIKGADGKETEIEVVVGNRETVNAEPIAPSPGLLSTMLEEETYRQIYSARAALEILLLISVIISVVILLAVLAK